MDHFSGFGSRPFSLGFMVNKVSLGNVLLRVLPFSPGSINPPVLHIYQSSTPDAIYTYLFKMSLNNTLKVFDIDRT
jgi:hypothetical protein